jgi:hypothetical protein
MLASNASVFSEAEDFEAALRQHGCTALLVTGRGAFRGRVIQVKLHRLALLAGEEQLARIALFAIPTGMVLLAFAIPVARSPIWGGVDLKGRAIITVSAGERLHTRSDGDSGWGAMLLPEQTLTSYGSVLTGTGFIVPSGIAHWRAERGGIYLISIARRSGLRKLGR